MRRSLNARAALDAQSSAEVEVVLIYLDHPTFGAPVRVSSDPTVRLSHDPIMYGTRSAWIDGKAEPYYFSGAHLAMPGDQDDAPAAAQITLDAFDAGIVTALRGFSDYATAHLAVVLASSPDVIEEEWRDLKLVGVTYSAGNVTLQLSRDPIENDGVPMDNVTPQRFPGLFA